MLLKSMGGIGIINIKLWNQAAQIKTCWDVAHKQDKMRIRWIHAYYIKGKPLMETIVPAQASWITRKILELKNKLYLIPENKTMRSLPNTIYYKLLPEMRPVIWKSLMFKNDARPKASFIMWLLLQGRLATTDRVIRWGMTMDTTYSLCQTELETREHLFVECDFAKAIWKRMQKWLKWQQTIEEWNINTLL